MVSEREKGREPGRKVKTQSVKVAINLTWDHAMVDIDEGEEQCVVLVRTRQQQGREGDSKETRLY